MKQSLTMSPLERRVTKHSPALVDRLARLVVRRSLENLRAGSVRIVEDGTSLTYGRVGGGGRDLEATIDIHSPQTFRAVAFGGTIGAGRAYMDGLWSTDDLPALIRIFVLDAEVHFGLEGGLATLSRPFHRLYHYLRRNTRRGSRRNISDHYDLGNDFYRLFLDASLTYSCGIFVEPAASMLEASKAKYDRLCDKLELSDEDHVLEIGCGWGGFALHAARKYGCRVTTTTISQEQYELASQRVREEGLTDRIEIVKKDYRDLDGTYDKLVSIEMIEAVGHQYYDSFFDRCARLLRPEGKMAIQSITIADQSYERHRREVDFIKRYIFPGSTIPSTQVLVESMTRASDLRLFHLEDITRHYVTTLQRWRQAFHDRLDAVHAMGYSQRFVRMWDFYLAYCQGGFAERYLGTVQMVLVKPGWRQSSA